MGCSGFLEGKLLTRMHSRQYECISMKRRVTLTIDPKLHERAKRIARRRRGSVSGLVEKLLAEQPEPTGSLVDSLIGSARLKPGRKGDAKRAALERKYLRG